jgi:hypothetical protein
MAWRLATIVMAETRTRSTFVVCMSPPRTIWLAGILQASLLQSFSNHVANKAFQQ